VAVNAEVGCILLPLPVEKPVPLLPFMLEQSLETRITKLVILRHFHKDLASIHQGINKQTELAKHSYKHPASTKLHRLNSDKKRVNKN
jgi:hypothetical protein